MPLTVRMNKSVGPDWIEDWGRCDSGTSWEIWSADVECRLSYGVEVCASPTPRLPDVGNRMLEDQLKHPVDGDRERWLSYNWKAHGV